MHIIYIHKDRFAKRPPVISALLILNDLGHEVTLIDEEVSDYWKGELSKRSISFYETATTIHGGTVSKLLSYYRFRKKVFEILGHVVEDKYQTIVWVEGAQTMVALGKKLNDYRHILQIQELHEKSKRQLKAIAQVIHSAEAVFMPEYNRTVLYQVWFKLSKRPILLPNKPYFLPTKDELSEYREKYPEQVELFKKYKIVLYQGHIHPERDLTAFVKASKKFPKDYRLVLMGRDHGDLFRYKEINPSIIHIDFIPAPEYLLFTSLCHIGVVTYSPCELNTAYCAPNKIYEYAAFGKPMIGNDVPGLKMVSQAKMGLIVDDIDAEDIIKSIEQIEMDYDTYSHKASDFFEHTDNRKIIKEALSRIVG